MSKANNLGDFLTDVADAIRAKKGTSGQINAQNFSTEIASIPSGGAGYTIYYSLTNCTASASNPSTIAANNMALLQFIPTSGYSIENYSISGASEYSFELDADTQVITLVINNPTGNVTITVNAGEINYFWIEPSTSGDFLGNFYNAISLEYSTDKINWTDYDGGGYIPLNQKTYFRADGVSFDEGLTTMVGSFNAGGKLSTLYGKGNFFKPISTTFVGSCENMFSNSQIVDASALILPDFIPYSGYMRMFYSCMALTTPPVLPAMTLTDSCYSEMFELCTHLTSIPALPATTYDGSPYSMMFYNCSSIKMSETQTGEYTNTFTFGFTPDDTTAIDMFASTGGTFTGTPTQQTYYTSNTIVS